MNKPLVLDTGLTNPHIRRATDAQEFLTRQSLAAVKRNIEPHINKVRRTILKELAKRQADRLKGRAGSMAVDYRLKEILDSIDSLWPNVAKATVNTAETQIRNGLREGAKVVNAELGTAYRTPLASVGFMVNIELIVKTADAVYLPTIKNEMITGMLAGEDYARVASRVDRFFNKGKGCGYYLSPAANARRVIRTETHLAHVRTKTQMYQNEGYTRGEIVNGKTGCIICDSHIGEIYWLDEGPLPVYHPHCG